MKEIKSVIRLLLESGFTRKEIKELKKNSKLYGIDLAFGVKDVGKLMLRITLIFSLMLFAFLVSIYMKQSFKVVLAFSAFLAILLFFSCFLTNIPKYAKSVIFYFKYNRK